MKVAEALDLHYRQAGLPPDGGRGGSHWRMLGLIRLPNFGWRRQALPCHDLHHVMTGYPCTVAGELEVAAWEFAAGRFPHTGATLFCLPLLGIGAVGMPRRAFAAFVRGRHSRSLYAVGLTPEILALELSDLRHSQLPARRPHASWADRRAYLGLVARSVALIAAPMLLLLAFLA